MENYDTLSQAITQLRRQGYTEDFNLLPDCLECASAELKLYPDDFQIDKYFRFDDETDPSDEAVLYAISSEKHGIMGLLVNAYGIYSDSLSNELLKKLNFNT